MQNWKVRDQFGTKERKQTCRVDDQMIGESIEMQRRYIGRKKITKENKGYVWVCFEYLKFWGTM